MFKYKINFITYKHSYVSIYRNSILSSTQIYQKYYSTQQSYRILSDFAYLHIHGSDSKKFLQGICTNDVNNLINNPCIPISFLNAKGRIFVNGLLYNASNHIKSNDNSGLILQYHSNYEVELRKYLKLYKLRSNVVIDKLQASCLFTTNLLKPEDIDQLYQQSEGIFYYVHYLYLSMSMYNIWLIRMLHNNIFPEMFIFFIVLAVAHDPRIPNFGTRVLVEQLQDGIISQLYLLYKSLFINIYCSRFFISYL